MFTHFPNLFVTIVTVEQKGRSVDSLYNESKSKLMFLKLVQKTDKDELREVRRSYNLIIILELKLLGRTIQENVTEKTKTKANGNGLKKLKERIESSKIFIIKD